MKVIVNFKKYKIENGNRKIEVNFNTNGIYQNNILKFADEEKNINTIEIKFFEIIVERKGEVSTKMIFRNKQKTKFSMIASFGKLELDIYTNELIVKKDSIFILYNVLEDINNYETYELHISFIPLK